MKLLFSILSISIVIKLNKSILFVRFMVVHSEVYSAATIGFEGGLELLFVDAFGDVAHEETHINI